METRKCVACGQEFPLDREHFYCYGRRGTEAIHWYTKCIECEKVHRANISQGKKEKAKLTVEEKAKKKAKPKAKTIGELQKEAQEHGMSYGKYVAFLETRKWNNGGDEDGTS
jgi:hypothetical protein